MKLADADLRLIANTIRGLAMDAVQKADSGHPGMPMGMADVAAVLWTEVLRWSAQDPQWPGRDRFVLSAGHGSMLLYAMLHLCGYGLTLDDLRQFRQLHSRTPGHPEFGETPGVETTTGPLGAGFSNGVGMALAAMMAAARFDAPHLRTRVIGIVSDGDLMEGVAQEAASLAGHLKLGNLLYLYDDNQITIEGHTHLAFSEDVPLRFQALGWHVERCDGHDLAQIRAALTRALAVTDRPKLVVCRTTIGKGSPNKQNSHDAHGAPLGVDEVALSKQGLGLPATEFHVDDRVRAQFAAVAADQERQREAWLAQHETWLGSSPRAAEWRAFAARQVPPTLFRDLIAAAGAEPAATRALSGNIIQKAAELVPSLCGGSADLDPSTKTKIKKSTSVTATDQRGRVLHFGIREHAMGGILNGMALHGGHLPMGSTFLVFSDYMRPAIRLAALMKLPVTFVFTHDSLMVGEDGPTHQPVEHLAALRLIPNVEVWRPADGIETAAAWTAALTRRDGPVCMALTRQNLPKLERPAGFDPDAVLRGGYVLRDAANPRAVLLATGAEVALAVEAAQLLQGQGIAVRVVSVPCAERLLRQDPAWLQSLFAKGATTFAVEMGRPEFWAQFTGCVSRVVGQSTFGASAPYKKLAEHFGFTAANVAERVRRGLS